MSGTFLDINEDSINSNADFDVNEAKELIKKL